MKHHRLLALGISTMLATGGGIGAMLITAQGASAVGVNHKVTLKGSVANFGSTTENSAVATFQCNDVTGVFKLTVKGVQVIGNDHLTPWDTTVVSGSYSVNMYASSPDFVHSANPNYALSQDAKAGLFAVTATASFFDVAACASGSHLVISGGSAADAHVSLKLIGTLS